MDDLPWKWILWAVAVAMAISSLVKLSIDRRDELQEKLKKYIDEQRTVISHRRKILAEHRRRAALVKRIASEKAKAEAEEAKANAN